ARRSGTANEGLGRRGRARAAGGDRVDLNAAYPEPVHATGLSRLLSDVEPSIARILERALEGGEISVDEGETLFNTSGRSYSALLLTADELRRQAVGDRVTYVVNRNINFTNVCIKRCGFCAFSRGHLEEQGYFLPISEVVRRAREAWD